MAIFGSGRLLLLFGHYSGAMLWIVSIMLLIVNAFIDTSRNPTIHDVNEGKAVYQETLHMKITNNDTVSWRTYKIVWIDERNR